MMKFKNIKTYERLKMIQPDTPQIELGTREEIDQKFTGFCDKYREKVFPSTTKNATEQQQSRLITSSDQYQQTSVSSLRQDGLRRGSLSGLDNLKKKQETQQSQYISTLNNIPAASPPGVELEALIDNKFKVQLQRNMNKENAVVKMFGNALIATVFQSLVIKTVEQLFKFTINLQTDLPISTNVLKAFGISPIALSSFKSQSQKADYVQSCMDKTIHGMVEIFNEKQEFKEKKMEEQDKLDMKKQIRIEKDSDHYPWLKIQTNYESLRKRLNTAIIQKLNDYENLVEVLECLKLKQELKKENKNSQANNVKFILKNTKMTSTKDIFQNMSKFGNPRIQQFLSRLGLSDQNEQLSTSAFFNSEENNHGHHKSQSDVPKSLGQNDSNATNNQMKKKNEEDQGNQMNAVSPIAQINNFWDKSKEEEFKGTRQEKKQLYYNEVTSSSWNEVGFLPFVQQYFLEMKKSMQRDHLLDRYADGEWLTAEELKLLADTSELLNSCIDRKFMQSAVDIIDKDVIQNLELGLAEDILSDYEEIQIQIKKSRKEFIKESLQKSYKKLREYDEKKQKQREKQENLQYHAKKEKMLTSICFKMEREGKFKEAPPKNLQGAESLHLFLEGKIDQEALVKDIKAVNYYAGQLEEEMQGNKKKQLQQQKIDKEKEEKQHIEAMSQPKQALNSKFYQSLTRHVYHPPSKIFAPDADRLAAEFTPEEIAKYSQQDSAMKLLNHKDQERFKLNLKAHIAYKNPYHFRKFYTGGPMKVQSGDLFFNPQENVERKLNANELKYIVMIQKKFRKYRQQKKMREMLENKEKDKFYEYKHKIEQIKQLSKQAFSLQMGQSQSVKDLIISTDDQDISNFNSSHQHHHHPNMLGSSGFVASNKKTNLSISSNNISNNPHHSALNNSSSSSVGVTRPSSTNNNNNNNNNISGNLSGVSMQQQQQNNLKKQPLTSVKDIGSNNMNIQKRGSKIMASQKSVDFAASIVSFGNGRRPSTAFASGTPKSAFSQYHRPSHGSSASKQSSSVFSHSTNYTSLFHLDVLQSSMNSEFKRSKEQLATKPIEHQLRNIKLLEAAKNNQFWVLKTANQVFSRRDLYLARDHQGKTALHWAAYHKNVEFVQWLIDHGADPNAPDCLGNTPTHATFQSNKFEVVKIILNGGGDLNSFNANGETPLAFGSESLLRLLNLTNGMKNIQQQEGNLDNNRLLKFITFDGIAEYRAYSYQSRFDSRKLHTKDPADVLKESMELYQTAVATEHKSLKRQQSISDRSD